MCTMIHTCLRSGHQGEPFANTPEPKLTQAYITCSSITCYSLTETSAVNVDMGGGGNC
jgi:hypothetical protein